jgi:hypothetical protein
MSVKLVQLQRLWKGVSKVGLEAAFSGKVVMVCLANTHSMKVDVQERSLELAWDAGPHRAMANARGAIAKTGRMLNCKPGVGSVDGLSPV